MELTSSPLHVTFRSRRDSGGFTLNLGALTLLPELCFVLGMNGSGKSVMFKLLSGDIRGSSGPITLSWSTQKHDLNRDSRHRDHQAPSANRHVSLPVRVGMVRQSVEESLALDLTVIENVTLRLARRTIAMQSFPRLRRADAMEVLRRHPTLPNKADELCGNLSLGMLQALALLCVLSVDRDLLLLDEFLASADIRVAQVLLQQVRDAMLRRPLAVMIISHDVRLALDTADRILVLRHGSLVGDIRRGNTAWSTSNIADLMFGRSPSQP